MSFNKICLSALIAAGLFSTAAQAEQNFKPLENDPEEIIFGFISTESTANLKSQWMPLIKDMENTLGKKVKAFFAPDYAGIIEGMRFGKVHVAWFGNKSAMEAVARSGGQVFAQTSKEDGSKGYYSHLLANAANDKLNSVEDILKCDKSLNFGIGDPNSTSGFLVPTYYVFAQNNVDPKKCFKTVRSANHETNLVATANKQVDVATNNSEQINRTNAKQPKIGSKVKVIWTSPLIPSDPMVYRKDLSQEMRSQIKSFFLSYGRMGENKDQALKTLSGISDGMGLFMESSNAQLYPIRQLSLYKDKLKVEKSDALSAEEKAERVAKIDAELENLKILVADQ